MAFKQVSWVQTRGQCVELLVCLSGYTTKRGSHSWRRPNFDCKRFYTRAVAIGAFKASWYDDHSVLRRWGNKLGHQRAWMNQWLTSELWQRRRSKPDELKKGALVLQCLLRVLGFLLVKRHRSSGFRWDGVTVLTTLSFHKKQWETGWWKSSLPPDSLRGLLRFRVPTSLLGKIISGASWFTMHSSSTAVF